MMVNDLKLLALTSVSWSFRRFLHMLSFLLGLLYFRSFDVFKGIIPFRPFYSFSICSGMAFYFFLFLFLLLF